MRIAIIGGGSSGMQTASRLSKHFRCFLFEKQDDLTGVWRDNYDGFGLQVPSVLYELPQKPSANPKAYLDGATTRAYLKDEIALDDAVVRLQCEVKRVERRGSTFAVTFVHDGESVIDHFDACVDCTGMYSAPYVPNAFRDHAVHSSHYRDATVAKDKDVLVVGSGKSAIDCALASLPHAKSVSVVARRYHWPIPRYIAGVVPFYWVTYSRLANLLLPPYVDTCTTAFVLHCIFLPLKYVYWRLVELLLVVQCGLWDRVPETKIEEDLFDGGQIYDADVFSRLKRVRWYRQRTVDVATDAGRTTVYLEHDVVQADLVVCGTGFEKTYPYNDEVMHHLDVRRDGLHLYRHMVAPGVDNLFFVGSAVSTFNNVLTHHLQARWVEALLLGRVRLPSVKSMRESVVRQRKWKQSVVPCSGNRGAMLQLHMLSYHDSLCEDMAVSPYRKATPWRELVEPYCARDYDDLA